MSRMITLRVSDERLARIDDAVATGAFATRAAAVTAALDRLLAEHESRRIDAAIVEGYTRIPPTADEDAWAQASGLESIREEPW